MERESEAQVMQIRCRTKYRITTVLKVETNNIASIAASPVGRVVILVIMYVRSSKLTLLFLSVLRWYHTLQLKFDLLV